jgi:agmatine deiminase
MTESSLRPEDFRMPAEWERHDGTWLQWPHEDTIPGNQLKLEKTWLAMLAALREHETVRMTVPDRRRHDHLLHLLEFFGLLSDSIKIHIIPTNDVWARDNGPIFVTDGNGRLAVTNWRFNGWGGRFDYPLDARVPEIIAELLSLPRFDAPMVLEGGAIEVNGRGTLMATRSSILNPNRNRGKTREEVEAILGQYLGIRKVIWLSGAPDEVCESVGDTTDYHVDIAARFAGASTVLYSWTDDESDPRHSYLKRHREELRSAATESGARLDLVPLPLPKGGIYATDPASIWGHGTGFTDAAYMNYYVANGVVLVPVFGNVNDAAAKTIIGEHFPKREIVGIPAVSLTEDGGAMHCVTQQQPAV